MLQGNVKETQITIGDTLRIHTNVVEGNKTRVQIFEGILIALNGRGENAMMTVRKIGAGGVGVERKWPLDGRTIVKVEVKKSATKVRRSKLYYLRGLTGRSATRV
jgi:large subunit ribosomal protein L19